MTRPFHKGQTVVVKYHGQERFATFQGDANHPNYASVNTAPDPRFPAPKEFQSIPITVPYAEVHAFERMTADMFDHLAFNEMRRLEYILKTVLGRLWPSVTFDMERADEAVPKRVFRLKFLAYPYEIGAVSGIKKSVGNYSETVGWEVLFEGSPVNDVADVDPYGVAETVARFIFDEFVENVIDTVKAEART